MTFGLHDVLVLVAVLLFFLAAFGFRPARADMVAAGLGFWALAELVKGIFK